MGGRWPVDWIIYTCVCGVCVCVCVCMYARMQGNTVSYNIVSCHVM